MIATGLFVDCNSLWFGALDFAREAGLARPRVDYERLMDLVLGEDDPDGDNLAVAYVNGRGNTSIGGFQDALERIGYEVHVWTGVEAGSAKTPRVTILNDLNANGDLKRIVIATQDDYFVPVVRDLIASGAEVSIACFGEMANSYRREGAKHLPLDQSIVYQTSATPAP